MPLNPLTETLGVQRAGHLLRRAVGGADIDTINTFALLTPQEALERLIPNEINNLPEPPLPIDPLTNQEWITTGTTDANSEEFQLGRFLNAWMIAQQLGIEVDADQKLTYTFRERLVFFLHTLFTTKQSVVNNSRAIYYQQALFRKYALDELDTERPNPDFDPEEIENPLPEMLPVEVNIKALTKKISLDNAMLVFLDGRLNVDGNPNENYARELLELYSIGRGLEGNIPEPEFVGDYHYFTETDVQEGARVLSGFNRDFTFSTIDPETNLPRGVSKGSPNANRHDDGVKTFSSRLGNATILPNSELLATATGEELAIDEISQLVDLIYDQEETAIHICRKLYRFYVYHEVSQSLQDDIISEMAEVFRVNNFKIIPVIKTLMTSTHFFQGESEASDDNYGGLIKSPLDFVVAFYKLFGLEIPSQNASLTDYYNENGNLLGTMQDLGMDLYEPFEVAGYAAYHQFPIYNRSWVTTNYLTNRYQFVRDRISNGMNMEDGQVNVLEYVQKQVPNEYARDARTLITYLIEHIYTVNSNLSFEDSNSSDLTSSRLNYFLNAFLFSPQIDAEPEQSWTYRWDNQEDMDTVAGQLVSLFNALLQTPEFQLM